MTETTIPCDENCFEICGSFTVELTASAILSITARGVPVGTKNANQPETSKSGTPDSAIVGTSGSEGTRERVETAMARSFPDSTCGSAGGMLEKNSIT